MYNKSIDVWAGKTVNKSESSIGAWETVKTFSGRTASKSDKSDRKSDSNSIAVWVITVSKFIGGWARTSRRTSNNAD